MHKRWLRALGLSTMLTFSVPTEAHAAPVIGAVAAFAGALGPLGGIVVNLGLSVVANLGASLFRNMSGQKPSKPKPNLAMRLSVAVGGIVAQSFLVGDWATAGSMNYRGSWGTDSGTPNAYYVEERVLSDLPMPALTGFWFGPQKATLLTGEPHAELGWPVLQARRGGVDHMWVKYRDGNQTAADPYLRAKFGAHGQFPYGADMVGRGRAVAIVTRKVPNEDNRDLFPANLEYKFETSGIALYDLSKDSTAGGFGSHRWNDPSTWEPSGNTAVQVYNILRGVRWDEEWMFGLQTLAAARAPASVWIAGINECNLAMGLAAGGTEPQFRTGAEISVDMEAAGVIEELLAGASGRIAEVGGVYKTLFGAPGAAVMSFTDRDIVVTREQGFSPFPRIEQTFNGIRPKFVNPASGWDLGDAPARYPTPEQLEEDGGRELMADVTLKTVNSVTRTQRLVKAAGEEQRRWRRHQVGFAPIFSELEPLDAVSWTSSENGYINKKFLVTDLEDEPTYLQGASLQEWDPADYDYDAETEEQPGWFAPIGIVRPPVQVADLWNVEAGVERDGEGRARRPYVLWTWDGAVEDVRGVAFEARIRTGPEVGRMVLSESTDLVSAGAIKHVGGRLFPAAKLEGRLKYLPRGPRQTDWTGWLAFDLPDTRMSIHDIDDEMRKLTGVLPGTGSLSDRLQLLQDELALLSNADIGNTVMFDVQLGEARAYFLEQISIVVDTTQAAVDLTTLLLAQFGGNIAVAAQRLSTVANELFAQATFAQEVAAEYEGTTASAFFTMTAYAGSDGWDTTIAQIVRYTDVSESREAGLYVFMKSTGETGVAIKGNGFYLLNDTAGIVTSPFNVVGGIVYMRDVRITGSLIVDETITTNLMLANAVTGGAVFTQASEISAGSELVGGYFNVVYGSVKILFIGSQTRPWESSGNFGGYTITVFRNGSPINSLPIFYDDNFSGIAAIAAVDSPGPGTFYYSVATSVGWGLGGFTFAAGGQLILDNFKR